MYCGVLRYSVVMSLIRTVFHKNNDLFELIIEEGLSLYTGKKTVSEPTINKFGSTLVIWRKIDYEGNCENYPRNCSVILKEYKYKNWTGVTSARRGMFDTGGNPVDYINVIVSRIDKISDLSLFHEKLAGSFTQRRWRDYNFQIPAEILYLINYALNKVSLDHVLRQTTVFSRKHSSKMPSYDSEPYDLWLIGDAGIGEEQNTDKISFTIKKCVITLKSRDKKVPKVDYDDLKFDILDLRNAIQHHNSLITQYEIKDSKHNKLEYSDSRKWLCNLSFGVRELEYSSIFHPDRNEIDKNWRVVRAVRRECCNNHHRNLLDSVVCHHEEWISDICFEFYRNNFPKKLHYMFSEIGFHLNPWILKLIVQYDC